MWICLPLKFLPVENKDHDYDVGVEGRITSPRYYQEMDSVQVGKVVFFRTVSYLGSCATNTLLAKFFQMRQQLLHWWSSLWSVWSFFLNFQLSVANVWTDFKSCFFIKSKWRTTPNYLEITNSCHCQTLEAFRIYVLSDEFSKIGLLSMYGVWTVLPPTRPG